MDRGGKFSQYFSFSSISGEDLPKTIDTLARIRAPALDSMTQNQREQWLNVEALKKKTAKRRKKAEPAPRQGSPLP